MSDPRLTYRFGPLERRGLLGPLRLGQVVTIGAALAAGIELLDGVGGGLGVISALLLLLIAVGLATAPVGGATLEEWGPVATAFSVRRIRGIGRFHSRLPTAGRTASTPPPLVLPPTLRGVELIPIAAGRHTIGAVAERRGRWLTSVLACQALSFALLDPDAQERRLAQWGTLLAAAATQPVRRLQWLERTEPSRGDELAQWLHTGRDPSLPARGAPVLESYLELIGQSTQVTHDHEILIAIQVDTTRLHGRAELWPEQMVEQVAHVARGLEGAEIRVLGALGVGQLARALRSGFDPYATAELADTGASARDGRAFGVHGAGPVAAEERWDHYRCDGALHATHWISGWPRVDVSPMFMDALLASSEIVRTVSVTFEPIAADRSAREVEAAITRDRADRELRRRFGQSETARQRQAQEAAARREAELAAGHGEVRFSGFVTVSGRDEGELRRACAEIHRHASRARLELRRMYGQQAEAFSFTLPLARGLR